MMYANFNAMYFRRMTVSFAHILITDAILDGNTMMQCSYTGEDHIKRAFFQQVQQSTTCFPIQGPLIPLIGSENLEVGNNDR
jgi:hypothetical protein